jgi:hypothetical protein
LSFSGSSGGRNDGTFLISKVLNSVTAELEGANFKTYDPMLTLQRIITLANALKSAFNQHLVHRDMRLPSPYLTHVVNDVVNISSAVASDLSTSITLLNQIKSCLVNHMANVGDDFHTNADIWNPITIADAQSESDAITLANQLRVAYESHRLERRSHYLGDSDSRVGTSAIKVAVQSSPGSLVGPFVWTLLDPRLGTVADSPDDVTVRVNGNLVTADAVFGMIGAVVLPYKPSSGDSVLIDYNYLNNPPARFLRLNSPEFVLNQDANNGIMGFPSHRYKARSYLIDPGNTPDLISAVSPAKIGWKYKAYERAYSATINDPKKLLTNSPVTKIKYPVLSTVVKETTISWDPNVLPQNAPDPWVLEGVGTTTLSNNLLLISDQDFQSGIINRPPFYTHNSDIISDSIVSAAFRVRVENDYTPDGAFTGVGFGLSDGYRVALVGFVITDATNLTSAVVLANSVKASFNTHLIQPTVHNPNDSADAIEIVDATSLESLIILLNAIKLKFNLHLSKADPTLATAGVHKAIDTTSIESNPDASDLDSAILLVNSLKYNFNLHRTADDIHFVNDIYNEVHQVQQVGILTNLGAYEFQENWESAAVNWEILSTYRLYRDPSGDIHLYMSGDTEPLVSVSKNLLPSISDFGGKFDSVQQVFFGSISREATSNNYWGLIRANINPLDSNLIEDNKSVVLDVNTVPESDPVAPWITLGHGGTERVVSGGGVQVESTCTADSTELVAMGASSGAFRGYMRFEPMLSPSTLSVVEFDASIEYFTFSMSEKGHGLYIDDGQQSVHFAFLYFNPMPAKVVGTASSFSISSGDKILIGLNGNTPKVITFSSVMTLASDVSSVINAAMGEDIASDDGSNHVQLIWGSGSSSYITIVGGSSAGNAATKLGLSVGRHFGKDSNPEPRVSWFGDNPPDSETVPWKKSGAAETSMIGTAYAPVMRITDESADYAVFTMDNKTIIFGSVDPSSDWKLDFRVAVISYTPGDAVPGVGPMIDLRFCGALANIDEGYGGKNVELHLSVDSQGLPFLNLVSYFSGTGSLVPIAQYAFTWNDEKPHSFNIFTNKTADQLFIYADGSILSPSAGTPTYSALGSASSGTPSIVFGSGGEAVSNVDMKTSMSVTDWSSVAVFRDSKLAIPAYTNNMYVGIYKGGDPTLFGSWAVSNLDWTIPTTYRIVRDPVGSVAVYINGSSVPSISMSYNPITLPPTSSSFLKNISNGRSVIAWGALDPTEISRGKWSLLNYSLGKLTLTDRLVPSHHTLNRANVMASPEHIETQVSHPHYGFSVYSGGTPEDDFMSDISVPAFTILGEGVPPVPMSQDLESQGGFIKRVTAAGTISADNFMNTNGFLGGYENDLVNYTVVPNASGYTSILGLLLAAANDSGSLYESHRVRNIPLIGDVHISNDTVNVITTPDATDLTTLVNRLTEFKSVFNAHVTSTVGLYHDPKDLLTVLTSPDPVDVSTCTDLANEILVKYNQHLDKGCFHFIPDAAPYFDTNLETNPDASDLTSCQVLLNSLKGKFALHAASDKWHGKTAKYSVTLNVSYIVSLANELKSLFNQHITASETHQFDDQYNLVTKGTAYDVPSCCSLVNDVKAMYNAHIAGYYVHPVIARDSTTKEKEDVIDQDLIPYQLNMAINLANDIKAKLNAHLVYKISHVEIDEQNIVTSEDATDLSTLIVLANELKVHFNAHRTSILRTCNVHVSNDSVNVVTIADATDLESGTDLLNQIKLCYDNHRDQSGVHGSAALIRIEPPDGILYEGMKFWKEETGTEGLVSPFSDGETWHIGSIQNQSNKSLLYDGTLLPEKATLVSEGANAALIVDEDTLILEVDHTPPVKVVFDSSDTSVSAVVSRINSFVPSLAYVTGTEIRLTSPTSGTASSILVNGGTALYKLGFEIPHHSSWFVTSDDPSQVTISQMEIGGEDFLRYGVSGSSKTMYASKAGYPVLPSTGFNVTTRIRINATGILDGEDSGIFVGVCCAANNEGAPGFVAAIGWGDGGSYKYVKLQDMVSGTVLDKISFNWDDGEFHTYNLVYDEADQTLRLSVIEDP